MGDKKKQRRKWQQMRHRNLPKAVPRAAADFVWQLKITDTQIKVMSLATE